MEREEIDAVLERLDRIEDLARNTERAVVAVEERMKSLRCGEHDAFIDGNGHPGAKQRLAVVEENVRSLDKSRAAATKVIVAIVLAVLGQVGLTVWNHVESRAPEIRAAQGAEVRR